MKIINIFSVILRLVTAVILLQTLYFKFTAHPESVELFTKLGVEPWGRIGTGVLELVTAVLIMIPATAFAGGFLAMGLMVGAIISHVFVIGIESKGDGGQLFILAVIVLLCSVAVQIIHRKDGIKLVGKLLPGNKLL